MNYDISISGTIGWDVTADFVQYMLEKKKNKRVDVRICSLGGYVTDGLDIYQMFKEHGDVHCHFVGMSASAATFLAMGAKEVDMDKHALILIHNGSSGLFAVGNYNKEQIDEYIKELTKEREQLNTIDDAIACIYADRCKKEIDEVKEKMNDAMWINAQDAVAFGLVDSIREIEDPVEKKEVNFFNSLCTEKALTELGLPSLPQIEAEEHPTASEGILEKVARVLGLKKPSSNDNPVATSNQSTMLKIFNSVAGILNVEGFNINDEDLVTLDQQQLKTVDEALTAKDAEIKSLRDEIEALKAKEPTSLPEDVATISDLTEKLNKAQDDLKAKDEQIANLQAAPADETHDAPAAEAEEATGAAFTNLFNH